LDAPRQKAEGGDGVKLCNNGHRTVCFDDSPPLTDPHGRDQGCPVCEEMDKRHELTRDMLALEIRMEELQARMQKDAVRPV
jgi:hypothetical protein